MKRLGLSVGVILLTITNSPAETIYLTCKGTQFSPGWNNNVPWPAETLSLSINSDTGWVDGGIVGGRIVDNSNNKKLEFKGTSYIVKCPNGEVSCTKYDTCIWGAIDRVTGKTTITISYGICNEPPQFKIEQYYDLVCTRTSRLF